MSDDELIDKIARNLSANWRNMHTNEALGHQRMLAGYLLPLIEAERQKAKAKALRDFADSTRFPNHWVLFRRDDGSGVTVSDLLRETAARYIEGKDEDHG